MSLDLVEGGLNGPAFRIEPRQLERWSLGRVEDIGYEPIALANAIHPIVDQSHQHAVAVLSPLLLRRIELGQVRAIAQSANLRNDQLELGSPDKLRSGGNCLFPKWIAEEVAIGQAQHVLPKPAQESTRDGHLSHIAAVHLRSEQHVG